MNNFPKNLINKKRKIQKNILPEVFSSFISYEKYDKSSINNENIVSEELIDDMINEMENKAKKNSPFVKKRNFKNQINVI